MDTTDNYQILLPSNGTCCHLFTILSVLFNCTFSTGTPYFFQQGICKKVCCLMQSIPKSFFLTAENLFDLQRFYSIGTHYHRFAFVNVLLLSSAYTAHFLSFLLGPCKKVVCSWCTFSSKKKTLRWFQLLSPVFSHP